MPRLDSPSSSTSLRTPAAARPNDKQITNSTHDLSTTTGNYFIFADGRYRLCHLSAAVRTIRVPLCSTPSPITGFSSPLRANHADLATILRFTFSTHGRYRPDLSLTIYFAYDAAEPTPLDDQRCRDLIAWGWIPSNLLAADQPLLMTSAVLVI